MDLYFFHKGSKPLLVSMPHVGLENPEYIKSNMTSHGVNMMDTDWYIDRLYDFLLDMDVSIIGAKYSRYVVDLNRGIDGTNLYPGKKVSGLCPTHTFDGVSLYKKDFKIDEAARINRYWRPYHDKISNELSRIKQYHGFTRLWDAHSIKSHVPELFNGRLPDLNLGTGNGTSADMELVKKLDKIIRNSKYTNALNGRFKGGYITRHYGDPKNNIDAIQLEISQITYMNEKTNEFDERLANQLRPTLKKLIETLISFPKI